jgi:hypothetical protein
MLAFRSVQQGNHCVREEFLYELKATIVSVRSFSTNSRPALRAASGRPPARQRHAGYRGAGLTLHLDGTNASRTSRTTSEVGRPAAR